jgi:hypothetical protein
MNHKHKRDWVPIIISIVALVVSTGISGGTLLYNYISTENMKRPLIEAVCQTINDGNGSNTEVITVTNKGGTIRTYFINVDTIMEFYVSKYRVTDNGTVNIITLTQKPIYVEVGYFGQPQYTNTKGDLMATVNAKNSSKFDFLLQDTMNEASRDNKDGVGYICTALRFYILTVSIFDMAIPEFEFFDVPSADSTAFTSNDPSFIQNTQNILHSAGLNEISLTTKATPIVDNLNGKILWDWCKNQVMQ